MQATFRVVQERGSSTGEGTVKEVDIKRYAKVEKVPGGEPADLECLRGVMFNKDVTHPRDAAEDRATSRLLLDCPLEYKKGDSNANVEITKEEDWNTLLRIEEEYIEHVCADRRGSTGRRHYREGCE